MEDQINNRKASANEFDPLLKEETPFENKTNSNENTLPIIENLSSEDMNLRLEIESLLKLSRKECNEELLRILSEIFEKKNGEAAQCVFYWSIIRGSALISNGLFENFKTFLSELLKEFAKDFVYSEEIRKNFKNDKKIAENILKKCLSHSFQYLAIDILGNCEYVAILDDIVRESIQKKCFIFFNSLTKKSKHFLRSFINKHNSGRPSSFLNTGEVVDSLKKEYRNSTLVQIKPKQEIEKDFIEMNKLIWIALENHQEKSSIKLLKFYATIFQKDYLVEKTLNRAVMENNPLFVKKYYDIFPFSCFRFSDLNVIAKVMEMLDDRDSFIHSIYLFSRLEYLSLSEIHVRLIIEKFELIWKEKLYFFTYSINPILTSVCICELFLKLSNVFSNVKVKLRLVAENFLDLAYLIKNQINDEIFIKTIYLKKMYPSPQYSLLQLLNSNNHFYSKLLASDIVLEIVSDLWIFQYYYTYNFLITSTAYQNLKGNLMIYESLNAVASSSSYGALKNQTLGPSMENIKEIKDHSTPAYVDQNALKLSQLQAIDLKNPFHFIRKSNFYDYRGTNHIFTYFFWFKSSAYKVVIEAIIYMIFFALVVENCFALFRIRRIFESFSYSILTLIDGFVGLLYGYPVTVGLLQSIQPWMIAHNVTNPKIAFYYASLQTTRCGVMLMFVPEFQSQCSLYEYAAINVWERCDRFFLLQYFFYFSVLGSVFEFIYVIIMYKKIKLNLKIFIDLIVCIANIIVQYIYYTNVNGKHAIIRDNLLESFRIVEYSNLVFLFLMWIKFFVYLKLTKTFGYVIKIIEIMMNELLNFFLIFSVIILAFALVSYDLLDSSNDKFKTFELSIRSLLEITYGNVFYDGFSSNETLAAVIITLFSVISIIIMLNLLVAILSNTYSTINVRSSLENANILYENYINRKPNRYYSSLIAFPPPLNLVMILFSPFIIFRKSSRLNKFLSFCCYSIYLIVYIGLYIGCSIAFAIPACWFKYILSLYINVVHRTRNYRAYILFILWILFGYFYLVYLLFKNDILLFIKSAFFVSLNKDRLDEISIQEINLIQKIAKNLLKTTEFVNFKDFCKAIRADLDALNQKVRRDSLMTEAMSPKKSFFGNAVGLISKKLMINKIFSSYHASVSNNSYKKTLERKLLQDVEIDKMEVFSLVKQYIGVDGNIMLRRMVQLLDMIRFCKKFSLDKMSRKQKEKLVNSVQIVDIMAVERAVLGILAENLKSNEEFEEVSKINGYLNREKAEKYYVENSNSTDPKIDMEESSKQNIKPFEFSTEK